MANLQPYRTQRVEESLSCDATHSYVTPLRQPPWAGPGLRDGMRNEFMPQRGQALQGYQAMGMMQPQHQRPRMCPLPTFPPSRCGTAQQPLPQSHLGTSSSSSGFQGRCKAPPGNRPMGGKGHDSSAGSPPRRKAGLLPFVGEDVTTLVVFNIPWFYKMDELLEAWPADGRYDYLNVLYNFDARHNVGYGFINFTSNAYAVQFVERWHGRLLPKQMRGKPLQTVPAHHQGLRENLARLSLNDLEQMAEAGVSPVVFLDGERVDPRHASMRLGLVHATREQQQSGEAKGSSSGGAPKPSANFGIQVPEAENLPMPALSRHGLFQL